MVAHFQKQGCSALFDVIMHWRMGALSTKGFNPWGGVKRPICKFLNWKELS